MSVQAEPGTSEPPATPTVEPIVRFDRVNKHFAGNHVLRDLDLEVAPAEKVAIIGPSGSGKTTILRLLMTLERIDSGKIWVDGECLSHCVRRGKRVPADDKHFRRMRRKICMVFQQFNLFPHMDVLRNVTEGPTRALGLSREQATERAKELLELVGLTHKTHAYPSQLSGGQQQRVAIARALAMRPKIMLFDEVTSALDPELVGEVLNLLRDLARDSDMTMLFVTHEMRFARDVADRVLMFDHGRIVEAAPPDVIFTNPENERTRTFLHAVLEH